MGLFFLKILLAHVIGDFLIQPTKWVKSKEKKKIQSPYLYAHLAVHALLLLIFLAFNSTYLLGIVVILVSHFAIDVAKLYFTNKKNRRILFVADQFAHLLVLFIVANAYYSELKWSMLATYEYSILLSILFLLLVTVVASILIKVLTSAWDVTTKKEESLSNAGMYIGMLERLFVFGFVLLDFWEGIGFLLAAKSIFRFGDLTRAKDRKLTEYVLIGTLLSFGIAILCGVLFRYYL
ncbi:Protein of unknown function [Pustulibacterium marinum]|uniref:DUF3307 domain-containing protein n=1 Tax=Pustulibacterium marinum TaxID=1224947 RepID=A0A1I7FCD3_9FLAO|nr:DUF3307 domain-containing protein [Pustulibacterium marinum]SFU33880.1 Protein of unknown function [Pustulibacterium marinum]